jgi:hypothetical protein
MQSFRGSINISSYYITIAILEPRLISENYQQRSINSGTKTDSDRILKPLMMTFSI